MAGGIWTYFVKDSVDKKAKCKMCQLFFSYKSSTGNLTSHLKTKHVSEYIKLKNSYRGAAFLPTEYQSAIPPSAR